MEKTTFGAGCFWGIEYSFNKVPGVLEAPVGYSGGSLENPTYQQVCSGQTGHAEVVQVKFDPNKVSFQELLEVLSTISKKHDCSIANIATKFILDKPQVAGVIIGARLGISDHREHNSKVFKLKLDQDDLSLISSVTSKSNDLFDVIGDCGDEYR